MSNLLPEPAHAYLRREYRARFVLAGSTLAFVGAVFMILALLPSYAVLFVTQPEAKAQASAVQQNKMESLDISRAQTLATQLAPVLSSTSTVSRALSAALEKKQSKVHIDTIVYTAGTVSVLALSGKADSRDALDAYRASLASVPLFTAIKLPVGDLIGVQGGRFTITLTGKF